MSWLLVRLVISMHGLNMKFETWTNLYYITLEAVPERAIIMCSLCCSLSVMMAYVLLSSYNGAHGCAGSATDSLYVRDVAILNVCLVPASAVKFNQ